MNRKISPEIKTEINKLNQLKLKPKGILKAVCNQGAANIPTMSQLRNYLVKYRKQSYEHSIIVWSSKNSGVLIAVRFLKMMMKHLLVLIK